MSEKESSNISSVGWISLQFGAGVWWYVWGIKGFWWGVLYGLMWEVWFGYRVAAYLMGK